MRRPGEAALQRCKQNYIEGLEGGAKWKCSSSFGLPGSVSASQRLKPVFWREKPVPRWERADVSRHFWSPAASLPLRRMKMRPDSADLLGPAPILLAHWTHASPKKQLKERARPPPENPRPVSAFSSLFPVSHGRSTEHPFNVHGTVYA